MMRPSRSRVIKPKSLAAEQADFTAEGAPPPGNVGADAPVSTEDAAKAAVRKPASAKALAGKAR